MMVLGCGVFGECLSYGGEFLMIGISAFIKRVVERSYSRNKMFCISMSDQVYKLHYLFPLSPLYSFFGGGEIYKIISILGNILKNSVDLGFYHVLSFLFFLIEINVLL